MEDLVPYCPICQASFMLSDVPAYQLVCNHVICQICLGKIYGEGSYLCYFDRSITRSPTLLQNLQTHLGTVYASLSTVRSGALAIDQMLARDFNMRYDKSKIPCKRGKMCKPPCGYNHNGLFYKQAECPFDTTCPNQRTCIFTHPGEVAPSVQVVPNVQAAQVMPGAQFAPAVPYVQAAPAAQVSQMAYPDQMYGNQYSPWVSPAPAAQTTDSYYNESTMEKRIQTLTRSDLPSMPTVVVPRSNDAYWVCKNCPYSQISMTQHACPQCSLQRDQYRR